jgi:hypothetical protein
MASAILSGGPGGGAGAGPCGPVPRRERRPQTKAPGLSGRWGAFGLTRRSVRADSLVEDAWPARALRQTKITSTMSDPYLSDNFQGQ